MYRIERQDVVRSLVDCGRDVSALPVGARVGGAFNVGNEPDRLHLQAQFVAQIEAALYASPAENTSLFASALLGLVHYRFEGPAPFDGRDARVRVAATWGPRS